MTHDEIIDKWIEAKFIDKSIYGILGNVHYSDAITLCRMAASAARDRVITDLRISHARYEFVRTLTPYHFGVLWTRNLRGEKFDAMVDHMILERAKAVTNGTL